MATTTAALYDMSRIADDPGFQGRVQAAVYNYAIYTILAEPTTTQGHGLRMNYAAQVLNNPSAYMAYFAWAAAANQILANDCLNDGNAGVNFTSATTAATVATATAAIPDTDISNAIAAAWNMMANV